jgi:hypothetical protein
MLKDINPDEAKQDWHMSIMFFIPWTMMVHLFYASSTNSTKKKKENCY